MYTILIKDDNSAVATERQRILQKSKLVDVLQFIVPKTYNEYAMKDFDFLLMYKMPISKEVKLEQLELSDENYKDDYLLYTLPVDTSMTVENGDIELQMQFVGKFMLEDGSTVERVREISPITLTVIPITDWFTVPDSALNTLTQYYLAAQSSIKALNDLIGLINQNKADNLTLNVEDGYISLQANGKDIGNPIMLDALGDELAEKTNDGLVKMII